MSVKERKIEIDVIKTLAIFSVISVHFFSNIGFYEQPIFGKKMFVMVILRGFFMICVPLFIMATGYLMNHKKFEKKYYKGIFKILYIYIMVSILLLIYKRVNGPEISLWKMFLSILGFSGAKYSWYVEMYIGLFLIIPFLNLVYNNLETKKQKIWLVIIMLFLTSIPLVTNVYNLESLTWWESPMSSKEHNVIFPQYWIAIYPITYYFIGCFICEYKPKINKILNILLIVVITLVVGIFNFWYSFENCFYWGAYQGYGSLFVVALSYLVFVFLINCDWEKLPQKLKKVLILISNLTLGTYLISEVLI